MGGNPINATDHLGLVDKNHLKGFLFDIYVKFSGLPYGEWISFLVSEGILIEELNTLEGIDVCTLIKGREKVISLKDGRYRHICPYWCDSGFKFTRQHNDCSASKNCPDWIQGFSDLPSSWDTWDPGNP